MGTAPARSSADILLELLDKVPDAATLEVLLESEHLLALLRLHGWSDADVRHALRGGTLPGELLLQLLAKEPDAKKLLAELGNPAPRPASKKPTASPVSHVASVVLGLLLAIPSGWFLFVKLDVLHVPGLIRFFPGAYALCFGVLLTGAFFLVRGVLRLVRAKR